MRLLPEFKVRALDDGSGYVIDAIWSDGTIEQLLGVFVRPEAALVWIGDRGADWVDNTGRRYH